MISLHTGRERLCWLWPASCTNTITPLSFATGDRFPVEKSYWKRPLHRGEDKRRVELGLGNMTVYPAQCRNVSTSTDLAIPFPPWKLFRGVSASYTKIVNT